MKRWVNVAGTAFAIIMMGLVFYFYGGDLKRVDWAAASVLPKMASAVGFYVVVVAMGALSWAILLRASGGTPAPWAAERQLLISQIGKYLPGNVFQYVGRAALTINSGIPARTVAFALVVETAVILSAAFLAVAASVAVSPDLAGNLRQLLPDASSVMWLGIMVAIFLTLMIGWSLASGRLGHFQSLPKLRLGGLLLATLLCTVSFLFLGVSLHLIVGALSTTPVPIPLCVAVFAVAWIAGLATPGAPGGLGVRESVLTLGLAPFVGGAAALASALVYRGVSVFGDIISLALGLLMPTDEQSFDGKNHEG